MTFKKLIIGLLATVASIGSAEFAKADVVYDAMQTSTAWFTGAFDKNNFADDVTTSVVPPAMNWRVDQLDTRFVIDGAGTYNNLRATVYFWEVYNSASSGSVFSNLLNVKTFQVGNFVASPRVIQDVSFDYLTAGAGFSIGDGQGIGVEILWEADAGSGNIQTANTGSGPRSVGSSDNGLYIDLDTDGQFESGENFSTGSETSLLYRLHATAVPEPGSLLFGLAVIGFAIQRNRKR